MPEPVAARLSAYARLMRVNRPIGTLLLLWPTLWALWLAAGGLPHIGNLMIFLAGVYVMRAAGCVINDFADRRVDPHVERTRTRPLATGEVTAAEALALFVVLCLIAFGLVLLTNRLTIWLAVIGVGLAMMYPFLKRVTHLPQLGLGAAFSWGIPMAFAAERNALPAALWLVVAANVTWTVVYDTFYAMVDRPDDLEIGVKSTAILFGRADLVILGCLQVVTVLLWVLIGRQFGLGGAYYTGVAVAATMFARHLWLARARERAACFKVFLGNNWVGAVIFAGLAIDLAIR